MCIHFRTMKTVSCSDNVSQTQMHAIMVRRWCGQVVKVLDCIKRLCVITDLKIFFPHKYFIFRSVVVIEFGSWYYSGSLLTLFSLRMVGSVSHSSSCVHKYIKIPPTL